MDDDDPHKDGAGCRRHHRLKALESELEVVEKSIQTKTQKLCAIPNGTARRLKIVDDLRKDNRKKAVLVQDICEARRLIREEREGDVERRVAEVRLVAKQAGAQAQRRLEAARCDPKRKGLYLRAYDEYIIAQQVQARKEQHEEHLKIKRKRTSVTARRKAEQRPW